MLSLEQSLYRQYRIAEIAYLMGIKPATLERYIREGKYPDVVIPDDDEPNPILSKDNSERSEELSYREIRRTDD